MPVVGDKYFFQSMPKMGTNWARDTLTACAGGEIILPDHSYADLNGDIDTSDLSDIHCVPMKPTQPVITVLRDPLDWMRSFWAFRTKDGWGTWPIDWAVRRAVHSGVIDPIHTDVLQGFIVIPGVILFEDFIEAVLNKAPKMVSRLYALYTKHADYVCRLSHIAEDVAEAFDQLGQTFDRAAMLAAPPKYVTKDRAWGQSCSDKYIHVAQGALLDTEVSECITNEFRCVESQAFDLWHRAGVHSGLHAVG